MLPLKWFSSNSKLVSFENVEIDSGMFPYCRVSNFIFQNIILHTKELPPNQIVVRVFKFAKEGGITPFMRKELVRS